MIRLCFIALFLTVFLNLRSQEDERLKLIYSADFEVEESLNDWLMEGPGVSKVINGKLLLHSKYAQATQAYLKQKGHSEDSGEAYYDFVEGLMRNDIGEAVEAYSINGRFMGGHIVFWNKIKIPDNYIFECDFQSLSEYSLHMLMFSHIGINGENVFSSELKPRNGVAAQYTKGDMKGYRVSFFAPNRLTTNLRKSPEKKLLTKGYDFTLDDKKAIHHLKITKHANTISWHINGQEAFVYIEDDPSKVLDGGHFAIRLMVPAVGLYDNIKVFEIKE